MSGAGLAASRLDISSYVEFWNVIGMSTRRASCRLGFYHAVSYESEEDGTGSLRMTRSPGDAFCAINVPW